MRMSVVCMSVAECLPPSFVWRDGWILERQAEEPVPNDHLMMTSQHYRCYSGHSEGSFTRVTSDSGSEIIDRRIINQNTVN